MFKLEKALQVFKEKLFKKKEKRNTKILIFFLNGLLLNN